MVRGQCADEDTHLCLNSQGVWDVKGWGQGQEARWQWGV